MRAKLGHLGHELAAGLVGHLRGGLRAIDARVELVHHAHDRDARALVASEDGPLHGSGAAPARQQRRMHVHAAQRRHGEHRVGQDAAVGRHAHDVGVKLGEHAQDLGRYAVGLNDAQVTSLGLGLDGTRLQALATTTHRVRARHHANDVVRLVERDERRHGKLGCSHEDDAHAGLLAASWSTSRRDGHRPRWPARRRAGPGGAWSAKGGRPS